MAEKSEAEKAVDVIQARLDTGGELTWPEKEQVLACLKTVVESEKAPAKAGK